MMDKNKVCQTPIPIASWKAGRARKSQVNLLSLQTSLNKLDTKKKKPTKQHHLSLSRESNSISQNQHRKDQSA